jgi:single-strand selective monofunctional uracil DNA glycosylase
MSETLRPTHLSRQLVEASRQLSDAVGRLRFAEPVTHVYNPLDYARPLHEHYLHRFGRGRKRVVFLGMNPGPWGMAQTGVPFGEVAAVRDWLGLRGKIGSPPDPHPKRPIEGLSCGRSEVSGRRLWGLMRERFGAPEDFAREHFILNYCPLVFMEVGGRNRTPDKLPADERAGLEAACDQHLRDALTILRPEFVVGVGRFAERKATAAVQHLPVDSAAPNVATILHPSPASPAANRDWAGRATAQLIAAGIWSASA